MMIVLIIACILIVLVLVAENKSLRKKILKIRLQKDLVEYDLKTLSSLAERKGQMPITQPYLHQPEAIKVSLEIIRLTLQNDQLQKDLKVFREVKVVATSPIMVAPSLKGLAPSINDMAPSFTITGRGKV